MGNYVLMNKNNAVATCSLTDNGIKIESIANQDLMPIGIVESNQKSVDEQITLWNGNRCIPFGRPNYKSLMEQFQIQQASDWIAKSYMCSLTDCYWFKPEGSDKAWEDVNFRENGFSSDLYKALFYGNSDTQINNLNSPDITTDGAEPKMWIEKGDGFYLLKHYSGSMPLTVCNEYIVSNLFNKLGIQCVEYCLVEVNGMVCCESKCFIDSNTEEFVTAEDLMKQYGYTMQNVDALMTRIGFEQEFSKMIIGDYLVGNVDRHSRNFGIIVDSDTKEIKRFAPLFDHGESYMCVDIDNLMYIVGETTFGQAINGVDVKYLREINDMQEKDVVDILNSIPYIDYDTKNEMFCELFRRMEHINELIIEKEIDHGRDY